VVVLLFTRGKLSYREEDASPQARISAAPTMTPDSQI
jgi:hypothetical protein